MSTWTCGGENADSATEVSEPPLVGAVADLLGEMELRLKRHIDLAVRKLAEVKEPEVGKTIPMEHAIVGQNERSSHFYRQRVPEHFRQLVDESIRQEPCDKASTHHSNRGQLGKWVEKSLPMWDPGWLTGKFTLSACSSAYEVIVLVLVLAYAALMGWSLQITSSSGEQPGWSFPVDLTFCILFTVDVGFRGFLEGKQFLFGPSRWWNALDCLVIVFMFLSQIVRHPQLAGMAVLRLLRIVRVLSVSRLLRLWSRWPFFKHLRTLTSSLLETSKSIFPLLLFVFAILYLFSMVLTEGLWENCRDASEQDLICQRFGTLSSAMMTLFQILYTGILWGPVWDALQDDPHSAWLRFVFLLFVSFSLIVVANVGASFLYTLQQHAGEKERDTLIQNEIESKEEFLRSMASVFQDVDQNGNGAISWTEFQLALEDERMLAFLASLGLEICDAIGLFQVLDSDSTGSVEQMEFLLGCLRLRGGAKTMDLVRIQMEQEWAHSALQGVTATLAQLQHAVSKLRVGQAISVQIDDDDFLCASESKQPFAQPNPSTQPSLVTPTRRYRTQLQAQERALTLQELNRVAETTEWARTEGWIANGKPIHPDEVNLYHFNYHHILPQTAPAHGIVLKADLDDVSRRVAPGAEILQFVAGAPTASGEILRVEAGVGPVNLFVKLIKGRFTTNAANGSLQVGGQPLTALAVTCEGSCSYKELLSSTARLPMWYCSHWWGEPIRSFVTCCNRHANLRGLNAQAAPTYWVCGYANRQHELALEMGQDLSDSSFYKALQVAEGILLILDSEAKPFSRIWCDYELYAAIMDPSMELDLITAGQGAAQMLSKNCLPQESAVAKSVREQNFPLSLLVRGLHVRLEEGQATVEEDKVKILNAMAGNHASPSRRKKMLEKNLKQANDTLHSTLAVLAWPQAMQRNLLAEMKLADVLGADLGKCTLELSLAHFEASCGDAAVKLLAAGLPPNLSELRLSFEGCHRITDSGVSALSKRLHPQMRRLYLDFLGCTMLTDASVISLASHLPPQIEELQLHFAGCLGIGRAGVEHLKAHLPPVLRYFKATFKGTDVNQNFQSLQELQAF